MTNEKYGKEFNDHLMEQYKLYVEMTDRVSIRRAQTNQFYITLLSGLLALLSIIIERNIISTFQNIVITAVAFLGLVLCFLWNVNINSYRQLNSAKFKIIHELEKNLPYPCYDKEWEILGEGKKQKIYFQLTRVEQYVPIIIAIMYSILLVYSLYILIYLGY